MTRDELKNAAYAELTEQGYLPTSKTDRMAVVDALFEVVEPLIRADERDACLAKYWAKVEAEYDAWRDKYRADIRAKVAALRVVPSTYDETPIKVDPATLMAVLALIDGPTETA